MGCGRTNGKVVMKGPIGDEVGDVVKKVVINGEIKV